MSRPTGASGRHRPLEVVSTVPLKDKHTDQVRAAFPQVRVRVVANLEEAQDRLPRTEVLLTYGLDLDEDALRRMAALRWIQVFSAGVDRLPLDTLERNGILVTNARGVHGPQMAEHALGVMLMHSRRLLTFARRQEARTWDRTIRVDELDGKVLGILGTGAIGRELARRAQIFGMTIWGHNRSGGPVEGFDRVFSGADGLAELLAAADYVVVLVPYTPETRGMIGETLLRRMKPTAVLVHLGRGGVVDESALVKALSEHWIAGAALDVFEVEPLPPDHPFWRLDNCLVTPHTSGLSPRYNDRAMGIFLHNLEVYLSGQGEWMNRVDPRKGY